MPVKIVHPNHVEIMGFGKVLLATPMIDTSSSHLDSGQIAEEAALTSRAFAVIGKPVQKSAETGEADSVEQDLRTGIEGFLVEDGIHYILEIEGKAESGVEVRTVEGETCEISTLQLVRSRLENLFTVTSGAAEPASLASSLARKGAKGEFLVETVRVAFGSEERQYSKEKVISVISEITDLLNGRVGPSLPD